MRAKEKEIIKAVYDKIHNIVGWHNKNLTNKQYYALYDCLDMLNTIEYWDNYQPKKEG